MITLFSVGVGAGTGATLRYVVNLIGERIIKRKFPIATLCINCVSCFLIGSFSVLLATNYEHELLMVGFCGGFSTLSALSLETVNLIKNGEKGKGYIYAILSLIIPLILCFVGRIFALDLIR